MINNNSTNKPVAPSRITFADSDTFLGRYTPYTIITLAISMITCMINSIDRDIIPMPQPIVHDFTFFSVLQSISTFKQPVPQFIITDIENQMTPII